MTEVVNIELQLTTHLLTSRLWLADLQWTVYPHKWSPISWRSSVRQGKFAGRDQCSSQGSSSTCVCVKNFFLLIMVQNYKKTDPEFSLLWSQMYCHFFQTTLQVMIDTIVQRDIEQRNKILAIVWKFPDFSNKRSFSIINWWNHTTLLNQLTYH